MAQTYIGVTLPIRNGNSGYFEQSTTLIEQIRSNFRNLILTKKGERLHQPELGCDLWKLLFEQITEDTLDQARLSVVSAIDRWMPFLELIDFKVTESKGIINISCTYRLRSNPNITDVVIVSFESPLNG